MIFRQRRSVRSECCVFILALCVLSDCDWIKYEAMPWHIKGRALEKIIKAIFASLGVNLWPFGSDRTFILAVFYQSYVKTAEQ